MFAEQQGKNGTTNTGTALVATASAMPISNVCLQSNYISPNQPQWKLDTCATAHMCDDIGQFRSLSMSNGIVKVGSDIPLRIAGKGMVSLHCLLPAGTDNDKVCRSCDSGYCHSSCYRLDLLDMLLVPTLRHCLLSWNVLRRDYEMHQSRLDLYVYDKSGGMLVFLAKYSNGFPTLQLVNDHADNCNCALPAMASEAVPTLNDAVPPSGDVDTVNCNVQDAVYSNAAAYDPVSYWHFVLVHTSMINRKLYADTNTDQLRPPLTA